MEEQTGKIFLAVFLAVLLAGAILLYLIPIVQEEREEQQREKEGWQKIGQEVGKRRAYQEDKNKYEDITSSIEDIEIRASNQIKYTEALWVYVTFLDSDGENINFDFSQHKLCYDIGIYNSAQERVNWRSGCISKNGTGTYVSIKNLPEDGTLKVSYSREVYPGSRYERNFEKEIKIKDIPIPTPFIPTPTPTPTVPGFDVTFTISSLLAMAYLVLRRRGGI